MKMSSISEFFQMFKDSLGCEKFTNLDAKGAKSSIKIWSVNYYKSLFENIQLHLKGQQSKIRSVYTFALTRTVYFDWICIVKYIGTLASPKIFCIMSGGPGDRWIQLQQIMRRKIF